MIEIRRMGQGPAGGVYALHLPTPEEAQTLAALLKGEQGGGHSQDPDGGAAAASVTTGSDSGA